MAPRLGKLIVLEGTDGSGKGTQFGLLTERLKRAGYPVATFDFPQYESGSSHFVRQYLNGNYGPADQISAYTASMFYALDRFEVAPRIQKALEEGYIVLCNRYTGSNMAHQGSKFGTDSERRGFFIWLDGLEYQLLGVPRPDLNIVLSMPAEIAQRLVDQKAARSYTNKKRDEHEGNLAHLQQSVATYQLLCSLFPKDFTEIICAQNGEPLSVATISGKVWQHVETVLPAAKELPALPSMPQTADETPRSDQPLLTRDSQERFQITAAGYEYLKEAVTNTDGNVYAMTDKLSPMIIAAAMARLSRRGDDMRITILDEFATSAGKEEDLLKRVITAYGDDSVQQLAGQYVVVEGASNLLTKKLEWGRLAAYLEQSTRYIYFDQKDERGRYRYYTPKLRGDLRRNYVKTMDQIFDLYSSMVHQTTDYIQKNSKVPHKERDAAWRSATRAQACDAIRPVLPVATTSTVGIYASGQALESLIMHLQADELHEANVVGQQMLEEARKVIPVFLERADKPDRGGAMVAYRATTNARVRELAKHQLARRNKPDDQAVDLLDYWPKNETELVADMLYEYSDAPLRTIKNEVDRWSYQKKLEVMQTYFGERLNRRHRPGRALEKAHYNWDLVCDYGIFRDLQRHRMVDDLEWQALTPKLGYEVPQLVVEAGLEDAFHRCFRLSAKLYKMLHEAGHTLDAQYATLLGHKMRWKITYNARQAFHMHELRTTPQGHPGYRKLMQQMHEKLCEVHPVIGGAMRFVNQDEDPELTRLAAERYTAFKLNQLKADRAE